MQARALFEAISSVTTPSTCRYHFSGSRGVHWARVPYMNKDLGAGAHATRFVGLAAVGERGVAEEAFDWVLPDNSALARRVCTACPSVRWGRHCE